MRAYLSLLIPFTFIFFNVFHSQAQIIDSLYSKNKEANAYYLKALAVEKNSKPRTIGYTDSLEVMVQLLEKAVKEDTLFIEAYFKLAKTYDGFTFSHPNTEKYQLKGYELRTKAKQELYKILVIDSTYKDAWFYLGGLSMFMDYNWDMAINNYKKAISLDTSNVDYFVALALPLALKGKWDAAQFIIDKANKMKPEQRSVIRTTGFYYYWKGDYLKSQEYLTKPNGSKFYAALSFLATNETTKALELLKTQYPANEEYDGGSKALWAYALIINGNIEEGKTLLNKSFELKQSVNYRAAACYVALGDYNKAIDLLEECYSQHGNWMIWLKYDRCFDPIRNMKRFKSLLKKMRFDK